MRRGSPYRVVSFHAHPDDEALLTAGTLARAAAEGHRVVVVRLVLLGHPDSGWVPGLTALDDAFATVRPLRGAR